MSNILLLSFSRNRLQYVSRKCSVNEEAKLLTSVIDGAMSSKYTLLQVTSARLHKDEISFKEVDKRQFLSAELSSSDAE